MRMREARALTFPGTLKWMIARTVYFGARLDFRNRMSDSTVVCNSCGERVPRKRFCFECGKALDANQPSTTSQQEKITTPVQVADSVSLDVGSGANESGGGQSTDPVNKPPTPPTTTPDSPPKKEVNATPSYAAAARTNLSDEGNINGQQSNQGNLSTPEPPAGSFNSSAEKFSEKFNVAVSRNDGTTVREKV